MSNSVKLPFHVHAHLERKYLYFRKFKIEEGNDMKKLEVNEREKADGLSREVTNILKPSHVR